MAVLGYGRILIICTVAESEFVTNSVFPLRESFMFLGKSSVGIAPVTTSRLPSMTGRLRPTSAPPVRVPDEYARAISGRRDGHGRRPNSDLADSGELLGVEHEQLVATARRDEEAFTILLHPEAHRFTSRCHMRHGGFRQLRPDPVGVEHEYCPFSVLDVRGPDQPHERSRATSSTCTALSRPSLPKSLR